MPIRDNEKAVKMVVVKESNIFDSQKKDGLSLLLLNLKSKNRKAKPFRVIEDSNKIHLLEKILVNNEEKFNLIKTFEYNE